MLSMLMVTKIICFVLQLIFLQHFLLVVIHNTCYLVTQDL